jgi:hypothetical protein
MSIKSTLEGSSRQTSAPPVVAPKEKIPLSTHLIAGGIAGLAEALAWYVPICSFHATTPLSSEIWKKAYR